MIAKQRGVPPMETDGSGTVTVLTVADRGLLCEDCGYGSRVDLHVYAEPDGPRIATLTGCTACRTGLYAP